MQGIMETYVGVGVSGGESGMDGLLGVRLSRFRL